MYLFIPYAYTETPGILCKSDHRASVILVCFIHSILGSGWLSHHLAKAIPNKKKLALQRLLPR